ncbi:hypothetical protein QX776_05630 [Alteromonadaceae bacterium BrNp21-10]|nr:hypothetical protein [Alteromonadaceae bacterium BrNp21-10]
MTDSLHCWQCNKTLENVILPMSRREECTFCRSDQHVCKMCKFFDHNPGRCNEERAEDISDREKANFCDYFNPRFGISKGAQTSGKLSSAQAQAKFAALFDEPSVEQNPTDDLISLSDDSQLTPAQLAEKKLRELLGD